MTRTLLFLCTSLLIVSGCLQKISTDPVRGEQTKAERLLSYSDRITEPFLQRHLAVIAHDSLEGRETGMRGQKLAARYLSEFYRNLGLAPAGGNGTFYQKFDLTVERTDSLVYKTWKVEGTDTLLAARSVSSDRSSSDYIQIFGGSRDLKGEVIFAGFGVDDPDRGIRHLRDTDLDGKWVLVFEQIPHFMDGDTLVNPAINNNHRFSEIVSRNNAQGILVIGNDSPEEFRQRLRLDRRLLTKPRNARLSYLNSSPPRQGYPRGYLTVSPEKAALLLGLEGPKEVELLREELIETITDFTPRTLPYLLDYRVYNNTVDIETENVLALLEGSDPEKRDEVIILTAHYDHIGITQPDESGDFINNGADDNGSGTVALMAIAEALRSADLDEGVRPSRSILFLHVSAEEVGLLGSRFYSDYPVFPIENTVAALNADMIGRSTPERVESGDTDYIFIIGGDIISSELDSLVHVANDRSVGMELDYSYNDLNDPNQFFRRSDHWNFGRLGIPFVFVFTGVHEDYHRPGDRIERIDFPKLQRTTRLIHATTIELATYEGRPAVDNREFIEITRTRPR